MGSWLQSTVIWLQNKTSCQESRGKGCSHLLMGDGGSREGPGMDTTLAWHTSSFPALLARPHLLTASPYNPFTPKSLTYEDEVHEVPAQDGIQDRRKVTGITRSPEPRERFAGAHKPALRTPHKPCKPLAGNSNVGNRVTGRLEQRLCPRAPCYLLCLPLQSSHGAFTPVPHRSPGTP